MARGAGGISQQQAQNSVANSSAEQAAAAQNQTALQGLYTGMINEGVPMQQQEGMTNATLAATAAPFDTARQTGENRAAATRNAAGVTANEDKLAQQEGQATGAAEGNLQQYFANRQNQNTMAGIGGLYNLSGEEANASVGQGGLVAPNVNATTTANNAWMSLLGDAMGAAGQAGGAYLGKG